jgi:hypothetical protein
MNLENSDPREIEQKQSFQDGRLEQQLTLAAVSNDRVERRQTTETPQRIETAKRFDSQLKAFADDASDKSENMKAFQAIVKDFNNAGDKASALRQIAPTYLRWDVNMGKQGHEIAGKLDAEKAEQRNSNPARPGLDAKYDSALDGFFNQVVTLSPVQRDKVETALVLKEGDTRDQRNERVRAAIGNDKATLQKFDEMEKAYAAVDAVKSQNEKTLEAQHLEHFRDIQKAKAAWRIVNLRAAIKF